MVDMHHHNQQQALASVHRQPAHQQQAGHRLRWQRLWLWRTFDAIFAWVSLFNNLPSNSKGRPWTPNGLPQTWPLLATRWVAVAASLLQLAWAVAQWPCAYSLRRRTPFVLCQRLLRLGTVCLVVVDEAVTVPALEALAARLHGTEPTAAALKLMFGLMLVGGTLAWGRERVQQPGTHLITYYASDKGTASPCSRNTRGGATGYCTLTPQHSLWQSPLQGWRCGGGGGGVL